MRIPGEMYASLIASKSRGDEFRSPFLSEQEHASLRGRIPDVWKRHKMLAVAGEAERSKRRGQDACHGVHYALAYCPGPAWTSSFLIPRRPPTFLFIRRYAEVLIACGSCPH